MMSYTSLTGRPSIDPYFDSRNLRPGYYDKHDIPVDITSEPIDDVELTVSYRAFVRYSDADVPRFTVLRIELIQNQSTDERRRGQPPRSRLASGAAEIGLVSLLAWDAEFGSGRATVLDKIEQHQSDRDDDYLDAAE